MKLLCLFLCLYVASGSCQYVDEDPSETMAIVGGKYTKIQDAPYQASVLVLGKVACGATIISKEWLITAAHCFIDVPHFTLSVRTGSSYSYTGGVVSKIQKVVVHPLFDEWSTVHDIALIKLRTPLKFDEKQKAINITSPTDTISVGDTVTISGFGKETSVNSRVSNILKVTTVPVVDHAKCRKSYATIGKVTDKMFCAGNGRADSCQGDSGGPAVIDEKLAGVISFGYYCALPYYPGVYTKISDYYDWIQKYTDVE